MRACGGKAAVCYETEALDCGKCIWSAWGATAFEVRMEACAICHATSTSLREWHYEAPLIPG